jgi:hypothetical protein
MTYDQMVRNLATFLRDELRQLDEPPSSLDFSINIDGRVMDGDLRIEFAIGSTYSDGGQVKGGDVSRVVDEYKRRFGWDKRNQPLCIGYDGENADA